MLVFGSEVGVGGGASGGGVVGVAELPGGSGGDGLVASAAGDLALVDEDLPVLAGLFVGGLVVDGFGHGRGFRVGGFAWL